MLTILLGQLNKTTLIALFFGFFIMYNLCQLLCQAQLTFFLGYKLLMLLYCGGLLVYFSLDILAFIMWIVYGSFIAVVFIFSFMWLNIKPSPTAVPTHTNLSTFVLFAAGFGLLLTKTSYSLICYHILTTIHWLNIYEVRSLGQAEELECLGWGLGDYNFSGTLAAAILLTLASITAVAFVTVARKNKWVIKNLPLATLRTSNKLYFTIARVQHFYQQEKNNLLIRTKIIKGLHRRRT